MAIKSIQITNYRAFLNLSDEEQEIYTINLPNGENLLIYGENGSGKSSLFSALKDFMTSVESPQQVFVLNRFCDPGQLSQPPGICIQFSENPERKYYFSQDRYQTNTADCPAIANGNAIWGYLSYRNLLRLHFHDPGTEVDYFSFFFGPEDGLFRQEILLTPRQTQNKVSFATLWTAIQQSKDAQAIEDYNINAAALITGMEETINKLLSFFEGAFTLQIEYMDGVVQEGKAVPPKISFNVQLFGQAVPAHHGVLNEARLTSLAISVYLAHLLSHPDVPFKFLFLDDIFIGLDTSNRMPLLKILTAENLGTAFSFRDFQLVITTYDREWFELSRQFLKANWKKYELYVDDHSTNVERPFLAKTDSYMEKVETYLTAKDYPAAANYLRKALEYELTRILPANLLYPGLPDLSGKERLISIPKSHFEVSEDTESWLFNYRVEAASAPPAKRYRTLADLINKFSGFVQRYNIPYMRIQELQMIKSRLLNPLSHDNIISPVFKRELILGLELLSDLPNFTSKIIVNVNERDTGRVMLFATESDIEGTSYTYRFEVLANVRYLHYGGARALTDASCRSLDRTGPDGSPVAMQREYPSIAKVCRSICHLSGIPFTEDFVFLRIFNGRGKTITDLINEQD